LGIADFLSNVCLGLLKADLTRLVNRTRNDTVFAFRQ